MFTLNTCVAYVNLLLIPDVTVKTIKKIILILGLLLHKLTDGAIRKTEIM